MNSVLVIDLILILLVGYLTAKPYRTSEDNVDILYTQENKTGNYEYHIYQEDSKKEETGKIEKTKNGSSTLRTYGYYYYEVELTDNDVTVSVNYTADENGFRATFKIKSYDNGDRISCDCLKSLCGGSCALG
ncbi:hypothetical protein ILUMI_03005 [Ignelater luminosus]|uniref:Uncharacterized protein n=1 Tax=Ignelater luminosus TaxID=2038154 RepID=A0A8K0DFF0_IGNLU|nr:hypothetical protein ILUMI_03005 [Ignelater luminosus]